MKHILVLVFGWFMLLQTAEGGMTVGPYDSAEACKQTLAYAVGKLELAGIVLVKAECFYKQEI